MKIVIDIPNGAYEELCNGQFPVQDAYRIVAWIKDGEPYEERKTGKWISAYPDIEPNPMFAFSICSICGFRQSLWHKLNYCPDCGARMEGAEDETKKE